MEWSNRRLVEGTDKVSNKATKEGQMSTREDYKEMTSEHVEMCESIIRQGGECVDLTCDSCPLGSENRVRAKGDCCPIRDLVLAKEFIEIYNEDNSGMFNVKDLKTGMIILDRGGKKSMVLRGTGPSGNKDIMSGEDWCNLEDLYVRFHTGGYIESREVMEVWQPSSNMNYLRDGLKLRGDLIWKREDTGELTVAEVSAKLGYKVKIVE
jgi:hypothetical protein